MVFKGAQAIISQIDKLAKSRSAYIGLFLESLENGLDLILNTFTLDNIKATFNFVVFLVVKSNQLGISAMHAFLNPSDVKSKLPSVATIGYYTGYIVGWIVQEALAFIITGGASSFAQAVKLAMRSYTELVKTVAGTIKKVTSVLYKKTTLSLQVIAKVLYTIRNEVKQLPKHLETLKTWLDELLATLKAKAILIDGVAFTFVDPITIFGAAFFRTFKDNAWGQLSNLGLGMFESKDGLYSFLYNGINIAEELNKSGAKNFLTDLFIRLKGKTDDAVKKYLEEIIELNKLRKLPLTFGKNKIIKYRKHAQQIRKISSRWKIEIPKKISKPETEKIIDDVIEKIILEGENRVGQYMTLNNCIFTKLDDALIIRKSNGEFVTFLEYSLGGVAKQWDKI